MPATTTIYAPHFEQVSREFGATPANIAAGKSLVSLYEDGNLLVDIIDIMVTMHPLFYPWQRLKAERFTVRTIIERLTDDQGNETITVHCVLPRWSDTYEEVRSLWKQHRTRKPGT